MIKSMTGYGRSEQQFDEYRITVEVKSVNNRFLDYGVRVYKQYSFVEEMIREVLSSKISRGKVDIAISFDNIKNDDRVVSLNEDVARGYYNALKEMGEKFSLTNDVTVSSLASFQDVFQIEKKEQDKEKITADVKQVFCAALDDLTTARAREGERLAAFFNECTDGMLQLLSVIEDRAPATVTEHREKIKARVEEVLAGTQIDETRLLQEVAMFSDKVNITEEIVRFKSHMREFSLLLQADVPVGRKLDFTIQELNREVNTMGSKCNDFTIGRAVVDLKAEIEKLREQVQNIE